MVVVANYRCATMVFNVFLGTGNQVFVGGGIAVFMRNWGINFLKWSYSSTPYTYTVGGYGMLLPIMGYCFCFVRGGDR